jgi:uncharacterized membrane protein YpjA
MIKYLKVCIFGENVHKFIYYKDQPYNMEENSKISLPDRPNHMLF